MTTWKSQQPEPARFPSYRVVDEAGNLVATVPIMADNKALERLALITAAPEMLVALREAEHLKQHSGEGLETMLENWLTIFAAPAIAKAEGKS